MTCSVCLDPNNNDQNPALARQRHPTEMLRHSAVWTTLALLSPSSHDMLSILSCFEQWQFDHLSMTFSPICRSSTATYDDCSAYYS